MYDLSLLKSLLNKSNYLTYRNSISKKDLSNEIHPILDGIDLWWKNNTTEPKIEDVANLTFSQFVPEKEKTYVREALSVLSTINGDTSIRHLLDKFRRKSLLDQISVAAYQAANTRKGSLDEVLRLAKELSVPTEDAPDLFVTDDIGE